MHNLRNFTLLFLITGLSGLLSACQASGSNGPSEASAAQASEASAHDGQEAKDRELILEFLKNNGIEDAQETPSGLFYRVIQKGEGAAVQPGNMVRVHYTGRLLDGTKFDSSVDRGEPLQFPIGQGRVIPGWDEGIPLFAIGGKGTLYIPSALAYGEREIPGLIPAHSVLVFDIEVVDAFDPAVAEAKARAESETAIQAYLKEKGLKAEKTESGLYYVVQNPGSGDKPANGATVSVHYTGKFTNGDVFDSSVDRGEPITFPLGQGRVIRGWDEGLALFAPGGKGILIIPPHLGYGSAARGPIPANSVLVFDVELLSVE
jgi:peptidylprolyl isomerase